MTDRRASRSLAIVSLAALLIIGVARPSDAQTPPTFVVNSRFDVPADRNDTDHSVCRTAAANTTCTLRAAIMKANRYPGGGVTIRVPGQTYVLSLRCDTGCFENDEGGQPADAAGDLDITASMTIRGDGAGATIIDANEVDRIFDARNVALTLRGVTLRNGYAAGNGGAIRATGTALRIHDSIIHGNSAHHNRPDLGYGGGIASTDGPELLLADSMVRNNRTDDGVGGGIFSDFTPTTIDNSELRGNNAIAGGGIFLDAATLLISESWIDGNHAIAQGGGVRLDDGDVTIQRSTISFNRCDFNGGGLATGVANVALNDVTVASNAAKDGGGGIFHSFGHLRLFHTTITGNIALSGGGGIETQAGGTPPEVSNSVLAENYNGTSVGGCDKDGDPLVSGDYNFLPVSCPLTGAVEHNITRVAGDDPALGPLQDNGGSTPTRALRADSAAIDRIPPEDCRDSFGTAPHPDQRGMVRPSGPNCDIGAYEGSVPTPLFGRNLVRNGDAEDGGAFDGTTVGVPHWRADGAFTAVTYGIGGFPTEGLDPIPPNPGHNLFAGGTGQYTEGTQSVHVGPIAADIDGGGVTCELSGYFGGYSTQGDRAALRVLFLSGGAEPATLGDTAIGQVSVEERNGVTGLFHRSLTVGVPPGTRFLRLRLSIENGGFPQAPYNDGYADNLSVILRRGAGAVCVGDCGATNQVTVADIIVLVNIVLRSTSSTACPNGIPPDTDLDVTIIIQAVNNALNGCNS